MDAIDNTRRLTVLRAVFAIVLMVHATGCCSMFLWGAGPDGPPRTFAVFKQYSNTVKARQIWVRSGETCAEAPCFLIEYSEVAPNMEGDDPLAEIDRNGGIILVVPEESTRSCLDDPAEWTKTDKVGMYRVWLAQAREEVGSAQDVGGSAYFHFDDDLGEERMLIEIKIPDRTRNRYSSSFHGRPEFRPLSDLAHENFAGRGREMNVDLVLSKDVVYRCYWKLLYQIPLTPLTVALDAALLPVYVVVNVGVWAS
jgi:hypothetical protein